MIKMSTLFKIEYTEDRTIILPEIREENLWVINDPTTVASIKRDGTASLLHETAGWCRRYDAKKFTKNKKTGKRNEWNRPIPDGFIPAQPDCDPVTGHWPGWLPLQEKQDKWVFEAVEKGETLHGQEFIVGQTYECCGPKINSNHEGLGSHWMFQHGTEVLDSVPSFDRTIFDPLFFYLDEMRIYLQNLEHEGIVFNNAEGKMCKLRRKDFGLKWPL